MSVFILARWRETCRTSSRKHQENPFVSLLKKLFFWNYERNTWQWDTLCVVILIFIFLTPKSWFENGERRGYFRHQSQPASIVLVGTEFIEKAQDKNQIEQLVRDYTGRKDVKVLDVRKLIGADGRTRGYEVDIR
jgi:hypothetical protein